MIASSTFTPTGDFGNSAALFSQQWLLISSEEDHNSDHEVSFTSPPR